MKRIYDGVLSLLYSLRKIPMIRYLNSSDSCCYLADKLSRKLKDELNNNQSQFDF